jgi:hypothetical protein
MNTCETCKFWKRYTTNSQFHGKCHNSKFIYYYSTDDSPFLITNNLIYWDYDIEAATFCTGETFGCIHWEAK